MVKCAYQVKSNGKLRRCKLLVHRGSKYCIRHGGDRTIQRDEYYYDSAVSLTVRVDWESHVSLPIQNFRIEQTSKAEEQEKGYADGSFVLDLLRTGDLTDVAGVSTTIGKRITFPRIK